MLKTTLSIPFALLMCAVSLLGAGEDRRLVDAARKQDKAAVRALLTQRVDVNTPQPDGATALHWAVHWDDFEITQALIRAGAKVNISDENGATPLSLACTNGNAPIVEILLRAGANPNISAAGEPPLMTAARIGTVDIVKTLLDYGADVNAKEPIQQQTALMWAAAQRHAAVARALIDRGADVKARSKGKFTPLLFAARSGDLESAKLFVAAGADVNDRAPDSSQALSERQGVGKGEIRIISALLVATVRGHVPMAEFLLDHGANPNIDGNFPDGAGYTPLHWAVGAWESDLTGANGIVTDDEEWSSMAGLRNGKLELVNALLAHGADPNARLVKRPPVIGFSQFRKNDGSYILNIYGATPFFLAAMAGEADVMRELVSRGADPSLSTPENQQPVGIGEYPAPVQGYITPLMVAAGLGRFVRESRVKESMALEAVKVCVELGADVNAVNLAGDTALHGAAGFRSDAIVQFLVDKGANVNAKNNVGRTPLMEAESHLPFASNVYVLDRTSTGDLLRKLGARAGQ